MALFLSLRCALSLRSKRSFALLTPFQHTSVGTVLLGLTSSSAFGPASSTVLRARIFDTPTGRAFLESCPHPGIPLSHYGAEVYGPIEVALPVTKPQPLIPPGGLAYSRTGDFLCVFFGQDPAWDVDYIGQIDEGWKQLRFASWTSLSVAHALNTAEESSRVEA